MMGKFLNYLPKTFHFQIICLLLRIAGVCAQPCLPRAPENVRSQSLWVSGFLSLFSFLILQSFISFLFYLSIALALMPNAHPVVSFSLSCLVSPPLICFDSLSV